MEPMISHRITCVHFVVGSLKLIHKLDSAVYSK